MRFFGSGTEEEGVGRGWAEDEGMGWDADAEVEDDEGIGWAM